MDKKHKFKVWATAFGSVLLVFLVFNFLADNPEIRVDSLSDEADDIKVPHFEGQEGDTRVGKVEKAMFKVLDEETKELRRVFGFETLLNPGQTSGKWRMLVPYMNIYDDKFNCEIIADKGDIEVETVAGKYRPTDARLYDNVVIRIIPNKEGQSETIIKLDSLVYNSERSEFSTDGPITVLSEDGTLEGVGMLLIYNNELSRVEFLKIIDLDYILITDAGKLSPEEDEGSEVSSESASALQTPSKETSEVASKPSGVAEVVGDDEGTEASKFFKCNINKDVAIRYGDELIVTSQREIVISNILWSSKSDKSEPDDSAKDSAVVATTADGVTAEPSDATPSLDKPVLVGEDVGSDVKDGVEVLVKCSGGLVIRPMDSFITPEQSGGQMLSNTFDDNLRDILDKYEEVDWGVDGAENPPTLFGAKSVDYNVQTGGAVANAPVELTMYSTQTDPDGSVESIPSVITANESTEFFADADRRINKIVFSGDVVGSQETLTPLYMQTSSFFGQKLIVDLYGKGEEGSGVKHVSVDEGKVKLEMQRQAGGTTINHVRLSCKRIDYEVSSETITAVGPGKIEINNENAPYVKESKKRDKKGKGGNLSLKKPCFALVEGFDRLKWLPQENRITADGKEKSVNMAYLPIVDGKRGPVVRSSVTHMQADFIETVTGRNELALLNAWGGVYYKEQAGNELIGDKLAYDVGKSTMVVTGTESRPCLANGSLVPRIEYNLESGRIRTKLSSSPGVISMPRK